MRNRVLMPKTFVILTVFLSAALLTGPGAWALIDPGLTLTRLHSEAAWVVIGEVESAWVEMGSWPNVAHEVPISYAEIRVEEGLKGEPDRLITVSAPGGEAQDGTVVHVSDTPEFIEGERVMAFLARWPGRQERTMVYGWSHGLFPIALDDQGEERVLSVANPNVFDGASLDEVRAIIRGEAVDDLMVRVRQDHADLGADRDTDGCQWCGKHSDGVADFYVNPSWVDSCAGSTSQQVDAIRAAADEWTDRGEACFGFSYKGTTSIDYIALSDGKNVTFATNSWGGGALAATWCIGSVNNGTDTEFFDYGVSFCLDPTWGQVDIQGVATHEFGHQAGMNEIVTQGATMYPYISGTGESARTIEQADKNCIQSIYGYCGSCWDEDGDGYQDEACGGTDCDDSDPTINPGATEIQGDGKDSNCNGRDDCAAIPSALNAGPGSIACAMCVYLLPVFFIWWRKRRSLPALAAK